MSANLKPQQQAFQTIPDDYDDDSNRNNNYQFQSQSQIPTLPPIQPVNTLNSASTVINPTNNNNPVVIASSSIPDELAPSQQVDSVEQIQIVPIEKAPIEIKTEPLNHVNSQSIQQQVQQQQQQVRQVQQQQQQQLQSQLSV